MTSRPRPHVGVLLRYLGALAIVAGASVTADVFSRLTGTSRLTSIFLSSVLLAAFYLGVGPGYVAAAGALVAHLYLVDPPYKFSLGSIEEMNALLLFTIASTLICLLAGRVRAERRTAAARAQVNALLLDTTRELADAADDEYIRSRLVELLQQVAGGAAIVRSGLKLHVWPDAVVSPEDIRASAAAEAAAKAGEFGTQYGQGWSFRALVAGDHAFGVAGWKSDGERKLSKEGQVALELLTDTGAAAITRAKLAAEKAEAETRARTEDLRNALLSSMSHDLRTPLATIMGSASSLRKFEDKFDTTTRRDLAATIEEEANRLDNFVSNFLQMSRLQSGQVRLRQIAFGVPEVISTATARVLKGRERHVDLNIGGHLPEAIGDPALFEQAFSNVLDNAVRYAGEGPIGVSAQREATELLVVVSDNGPGVGADDLDRIFEKFHRSSSSEKVAGTGLGLAISRGLMQGMGGRVWAERRPEGGLAVLMALPLAVP